MTEPEQRLWDAYPTGTQVQLGEALPHEETPDRTVRAEVIAQLLLGRCEQRPGFVPAVRLRGAYITGRLDVSGGTVGSELRLERCHLAERPTFSNAEARQLRIAHCRLPGFDGGGLRANGYLSLSGSVIEGEVRLTRAHLMGGLRMNGTKVTVTDPDKWAMFTGGMVVEVGAFIRDAELTGGVRLVGARMNGGVFFEGTTLRNQGRLALDAQNMVVEDAAEFSKGFTCEGTARLRGVRVNGTLSFDQAILRSPGRGALHASHAQIDELIFAPAEPVVGWVSLSYSRIGVIRDRPPTWPERLQLDGLVYDSLHGGEPKERLDWIRHDEQFHPQVYEQLATWFRGSGLDDLARKTQLAKLRARRRTLPLTGRVWNHLLDWTVGYGFRPWLAAMWLSLLVAVGTTVFSAERPRAIKPPDERPHLHTFIYTLDLLIPIGTFGQRDAWEPVGWTQWLAYVLIAAGWILATALIAGATRVLRPN
ncbi:hypothetical protein HKK72_05810 [Actinomadura sp. HBU206391]|nr:hypothetical protein [Actinomadura sp. HBU206391]